MNYLTLSYTGDTINNLKSSNLSTMLHHLFTSFFFRQAELGTPKLEALADGTSLLSRVATLETEMAELSIDSSADLGHVQHGLLTAQEEMQGLRSFTADQLTTLEENLSEISKAMESMEEMRMKMTKMTCSVDELSEKVAAMEIDLNEQAITASALNGHLESGVATAKQDALSTSAIQIQLARGSP